MRTSSAPRSDHCCDGSTSSGARSRFSQWRRLPAGLIVPILLCLFLWNVHSITISMMGKSSVVWNITPMQHGTSALLRQSSSRYPMSNIVLMGQFNYDVGPDLVKSWAKIWSKYFKHIVAAGPFAVKTFDELKASGIQVRKGASDRGHVSPYENLMETMLDYHRANSNNDSSRLTDKIDGVLYAHDDALLNLTRLFEGDETVPFNTIISTFKANATIKSFLQYSVYVEHQRWRWSDGKEESRVSPVVYFENTPEDNRTMISTSLAELVSRIPTKWPRMTACLQQQLKMLSKYDKTWWETFSDYSTGPALSEDVIGALKDSRSAKLTFFRNSYRFSFPGCEQSDFLYMPLKYTKLFEQAARPHAKSKVFLECAIPTIVQWVIQAAKKKSMAPNEKPQQNDPNLTDDVVDPPKLKEVPLCTDWSLATRGTDNMLMDCIRVSSDWGMFHPKKLGRIGSGGAAMYEMWLDQIQGSPTDATFSLLAAALDTQNSTTAKNVTYSIES